MFDSVIADVGTDPGEWEGIYGDPYSDLGVDMFGDLRLEDIPTPGPRAVIPTSSNVVVQAVANKVKQGMMKAPERQLTKPVRVVRRGVTPSFKLPRIDSRKAAKLAAVGIGAIILWELLRKK
jgi:hypothetical protein